MEMAQYLSVFMDECQEHLHTLNMSLLALESDPEDTSLLEAIFRAAHTLKGASATMGFNKMANITHAMEDVLSKLRTGEIAITPEIVNLLFECFDLLDALAQGIAIGHEEDIETEGLLGQLRLIVSGGQPEKRLGGKEAKRELRPVYSAEEKDMVQHAVEAGISLFHVTVRLRPDCLLKGARAFMVLRDLEKLGQFSRTWPAIKDLEDENFDDAFMVGLLSTESPDRVKIAGEATTDVLSVSVEPVKVDALSVEASTVATAPTSRPTADSRPTQLPRLATGQTVRVEIKKLDELMNLVAELVIQHSTLEQLSGQLKVRELSESVEQVERLTLELRDQVLRARMVQVNNVFSRFPRLVRDLSRELGKEVHLEIIGGETELDRTVIDQVGDPLMHVIRNAVDHGIESPDERASQGKARAGVLTLRAFQESNSVEIVVEDDGRGMNLRALRDRAFENGQISAAQFENITPEEMVDLVFLPGLSTARKVTDISGRGVGMDVVKKVIEGLGGVISVRTQQGQGTSIHIRLPLTLAIIQTLLVSVGGELFAIPAGYIDQTVSVSRDQMQNSRGQNYAMVRGEPLPILDLERVLQVRSSAAPPPDVDVVIVKLGDRRVGYVVHQLLRQQDVVIKALGSYLGRVPGIAGGTILGDGRVALILDVRTLA